MKLFIILFALLTVASTLRLSFGEDIEYKIDESITWEAIQSYKNGGDWPWLGQASSTGWHHPGLGLWLHMAPFVIFDFQGEMGVAKITQIFSCLGLLLMLLFTLCLKKPEEQIYWAWGFALACVNPLAVLLERKIWQPSLLPFFTMALIAAWWARNHAWRGAFLWGLLGAWIGQIHMSGFFFTLALLLWTWFFDKERAKIRWKQWWLGSALGGISLLPWLYWVLQNAGNEPLNIKLHRWIMFRYWLYWVRNAFGWNSKYPLGEDVYSFYRWPFIFEAPSYLVGFAHLLLIFGTVYFTYLLLSWAWKQRKNLPQSLTTHSNQTRLLLNAGFLGCGIIVTLSAINVTRYFHLAVHPLPYVFLAYAFLRTSRWAHQILSGIVLTQLFISIFFLLYVNKVQVPIRGDYGSPFSLSRGLKR